MSSVDLINFLYSRSGTSEKSKKKRRRTRPGHLELTRQESVESRLLFRYKLTRLCKSLSRDSSGASLQSQIVPLTSSPRPEPALRHWQPHDHDYALSEVRGHIQGERSTSTTSRPLALTPRTSCQDLSPYGFGVKSPARSPDPGRPHSRLGLNDSTPEGSPGRSPARLRSPASPRYGRR